ncbi:MAG: mannonate dehydratase [Anaerolineae bacterium]|nr:mannonate dehydratase [Anaerolineae bacterium]
MIRISVWDRGLSERYLRQVTQLGAERIDFGSGTAFPGVTEQGYPDLDQVRAIRRRIRAWGLDINRVTLPDIGARFMEGLPGGDRELENAGIALRVYAQAGIPIARQRFAGDASPGQTSPYRSVHRGGYRSRGEYQHQANPTLPAQDEVERRWRRFCDVYDHLVPIAEEHGIRLAIHPSDTPYPGTPFDALGFHRVVDAFPSSQVGYLYCVGTRAEAGGTPLILNEIENYGRKGRLFAVHFRNVRGSLATAGGFEEVLLDDGDMNMFRVLLALHRVGYDGCLNPDHIPHLEGDGEDASLGLAYSIGYIKALLAALVAMS